MTKFENVGVEHQYEAVNRHEANARFRNSCAICCSHGVRLECEKCAIRQAHELTIGYFDSRDAEYKAVVGTLKGVVR